MRTNYRILRPGFSQVTGQLSRSPASQPRHAALTWNYNSDGNFHFRARLLSSVLRPPTFSSLLPCTLDVFLFFPVRRVERHAANSGTSTAGTDVIIISKVVWLSNFFREPWAPGNVFVHFHRTSSQFADATVRNMLCDNEVFFVVQPISRHCFPQVGPEKRLGIGPYCDVLLTV